MSHFNTWRHDRRGADEGRVHVGLRGRYAGGTTGIVTVLVHAGHVELGVEVLLLEHGRWLGHPCVAKPVENVDVAGIGILRCILEHGVGEAWEDVMNLVQEQGQHPMVAIADYG